MRCQDCGDVSHSPRRRRMGSAHYHSRSLLTLSAFLFVSVPVYIYKTDQDDQIDHAHHPFHPPSTSQPPPPPSSSLVRSFETLALSSYSSSLNQQPRAVINQEKPGWTVFNQTRDRHTTSQPLNLSTLFISSSPQISITPETLPHRKTTNEKESTTPRKPHLDRRSWLGAFPNHSTPPLLEPPYY